MKKVLKFFIPSDYYLNMLRPWIMLLNGSGGVVTQIGVIIFSPGIMACAGLFYVIDRLSYKYD